MNVYYDESGLGKKVCIALGMFDGMHKAHLDILRACAEYANNNNGNSYAYTFHSEPKPKNGNGDFIVLTTLEEKLRLIEETGIQNTIVMRFDKDYAQASPEQFLRRICKGRRVKAIFCGYDFRFGHKAQGDTDYLKEMSDKLRYKLFITEQVLFEGEPLSSSSIRKELVSGSFEKALSMLGRPYFAQMVVHSRKTVEGTDYLHGVFNDYYNLANGLYKGNLKAFEDSLDCEVYVYNKTVRVNLPEGQLEKYNPRIAEMHFLEKIG